MFRLLEAGPRLSFEIPFARKSPQEFEKFFEVSPSDLHCQISVPSPVAFPSLPEPFRIRFDASIPFILDLNPRGCGALRVAITTGDEREIWTQQVFAQHGLKRSAQEIHELAMRYAPVFLFSSREEYFPVRLHDLFLSDTIQKSRQIVKVKTVFGQEEIPLKNLFDFLRYNGHSTYLLNQSVLDISESDFYSLHGEAGQSTVYYSYIEDFEKQRFFINYHTFYAFDPKTGIAKLLNIGPHIFDRESMTISFNDQEQPEDVVVSGHLENQTIGFFNKLMVWSCGRVRYGISHPDTPQINGHPVVPVAEGSHALYPAAGHYKISVLNELAGHVLHGLLPQLAPADNPDDLHGRQVLLPPALASNSCKHYDLVPLRLDRLKSDPDEPGELYDGSTAALVFSGYWVDVPGIQNERFPPFSRKECEIEDWIDNAYFWDWERLPSEVLAHNHAITEAIRKQL